MKKSRDNQKNVGARKGIDFGSPNPTLATPMKDITLCSPLGVQCLQSTSKKKSVSFGSWDVESDSCTKPTKLKKVPSTASEDSGISEVGSHPAQVPKSVKQRTSEWHKKFKIKDPAMRCAVVINHLMRVRKSPRTKKTFPIIAKQIPHFQSFIRSHVSSVSFVKQQRELHSDVRKVIASRAKGKMLAIREIRDKWVAQKFSLRYVARVTNTTFSHLQWLLNPPTINPRKITKDDRRVTIEYFTQNNITMQLPLKRHAHKYFFRTGFNAIHMKYAKDMKEKGFRVLSKSSVWRVLPKRFFKTVDKLPVQGCLCLKCENVRLLLLALKNAKVLGFSRRLRESTLKTVCSGKCSGDGDITNVNRQCLVRKCMKCLNKTKHVFDTANPDLDRSKRCAWHQWQSVFGPPNSEGVCKRIQCEKVLSTGTIGQLINLLTLQMGGMPLHLFDVQWQGDQFELAKETLKPGQVLTVMDFAKNFTLERQREVQFAFFCRQSVTLHPVVCYFLCPQGCGNVLCDEVMMITADRKHDAHAVEAFQNKAVEHLQKTYNFEVQKLITFTDNCSGQYKCHQAFAYLARSHLLIEKHYFGAGHGKGPGDASVGRFKRELDLAIRGKKADIQMVADVATYAEKHLTITTTKDMCSHRARHFYLIEEINRDFESTYGTVKGTRSFHSVKNTDRNAVSLVARVSSCFCRYITVLYCEFE
jgi:hypothetical protein